MAETPNQKRWRTLTEKADNEKTPFGPASASMKVIREQQANSRKEGNVSDLPGSPYAKGYFERPASVIREHNEAYRRDAQDKVGREMSRVNSGDSPLKDARPSAERALAPRTPIAPLPPSKFEPKQPITPERIEGSLKKGGPIEKAGLYRLHSGERVLNRGQAKRFQKGVRVGSRRGAR